MLNFEVFLTVISNVTTTCKHSGADELHGYVFRRESLFLTANPVIKTDILLPENDLLLKAMVVDFTTYSFDSVKEHDDHMRAKGTTGRLQLLHVGCPQYIIDQLMTGFEKWKFVSRKTYLTLPSDLSSI